MRSWRIGTVLVWATAAAAAAQDPPPRRAPDEEPRRPGVELRAAAMRFDNFFQRPDGAPQEDVGASALEARLAWPLADPRLSVLGTASYVAYGQGLDDSPGVGVGLRWEGRPQAWELRAEQRWDQPVFDVGDTLETADVLRMGAEYAVRFSRAWEGTALAEWERQDFALTPGKDNERPAVGLALRYRGWGSELSPEVGLELGERDAGESGEDYDERDVWLKLRSAPTRRAYLSLRLRQRDREYQVDDPRARNFGREDDRRDVTLTADYRLTEQLGLALYATYLDAESTRTARTFETSLVSLGASWRW